MWVVSLLWDILTDRLGLSCIFSVYFAVIYWLWRWGMRWEDVQVTVLSGVSLSNTLLSPVALTGASPYFYLPIVCLTRRGGGGWGWWGTGDKNHSRADTLHQSHVKQSHHQGADWVWSAQVSTLHHLHLQHEEYLAIVVWAHLLLRLSKYNSRMTSNTKLRMSNIKYKISQHVVIHET